MGAGNPHLCILFLRDFKSEKREIGNLPNPEMLPLLFNMDGCSANVEKKGKVSKCFLDMCALSGQNLRER